MGIKIDDELLNQLGNVFVSTNMKEKMTFEKFVEMYVTRKVRVKPKKKRGLKNEFARN